MNLRDLESLPPSGLSGLPLLLVLASIVRGRRSGLLRIKTDKITRQFQFREGSCLSAQSNARSEAAGSFLHKRGRISEAQLQTFMAEIAKPETKPWSLVQKIGGLDASELSTFRSQLTEMLLAECATAPSPEIVFQVTAPASAEGGIHGLRALLSVTSRTLPEKFTEIMPEFRPESALVPEKKLEQIAEGLPLDPEERGLLTVVRNSSTVADVFSGSFLKPDRIWTLLAAYCLAGLVHLVSAESVAQQKHEATLTPELKALREEMATLYAALPRSSYYHWIGSPPQASVEEIARTATSRIERFAATVVDRLFMEKEKEIPPTLLTRLTEAKRVLTDPTQRTEYDAYLASGRTGSFLRESVSVREEETTRKAEALLAAGHADQAAAVYEEALTQGQPSHRILAAWARAILRAHGAQDLARRNGVLQRLQPLAPQSALISEALGEWLEALGQSPQALEAYRRAAELDPDSPAVRQALDRLDPGSSAKTLLASIHSRLGKVTHYQLLGVAPNATAADIQKAYRDATRRFHPDRFFQSDDIKLKQLANETYKRMTEAYVTLKNASRRRDYDIQIERPVDLASSARPPITGPAALPKTMQGKKFYDLALLALRQGKFDAAKLNLQLGLQLEPNCPALKDKLSELTQRP